MVLFSLSAACAPDPSRGDADAGTAVDGGADDGTCPTGGGEASVGACLVAAHAGTYTVTASTGAHQRGSVVVAEDGAIDYDTDLQFAVDDQAGVYDRLDCCQRISVEMEQRPDKDTSLAPDARHRVDLFLSSSTVGSDVVRFEYYPNWPSENGKVVLDVQ